jgi:hypothetical protein
MAHRFIQSSSIEVDARLAAELTFADAPLYRSNP